MSENHPVSEEEFFDQYDELACAVIDDRRPNTHMGMEMSNAEIAEDICTKMEWETFDLLEPMPFDKIYDRGSVTQLLSYCYLAYLRWELFSSARIQGLGEPVFNELACTYAEYWYLRLRDKYMSLHAGEQIDHDWIH